MKLSAESDPPENGEDYRTALITRISSRLKSHLHSLGVNGEKREFRNKDAIRALHRSQRLALLDRERPFVEKYGEVLLASNFADGREIDPISVDPVLAEVTSGTEDARLFRLATLLWSVPVSRGFGRRMRYLVRDGSNGKLIGLFALCDPVFNLTARDTWIGWDADDRRQRLVNVMDAYVVGAVPPYSQLLGGKVVASVMTSQQVCDRFAEKYGNRPGIISKRNKHAKLALITVTSALGRSSLYNRLRLPSVLDCRLLGRTQGWGHFHVPDDIFADMRHLLSLDGHGYAFGYKYGEGPNWRMRVVRAALTVLGLRSDLLRHGITREVYGIPMARGWRQCLRDGAPCEVDRPPTSEVGRLAVERWLIGRASRMPSYRQWTRLDTWRLLALDE